jgi:hypothetical protein
MAIGVLLRKARVPAATVLRGGQLVSGPFDL